MHIQNGDAGPQTGYFNLRIEETEVQAAGHAGPYEGCDSPASLCVMGGGCELPPHGTAVQWANGHMFFSKPAAFGECWGHRIHFQPWTVPCCPPPVMGMGWGALDLHFGHLQVRKARCKAGKGSCPSSQLENPPLASYGIKGNQQVAE